MNEMECFWKVLQIKSMIYSVEVKKSSFSQFVHFLGMSMDAVEFERRWFEISSTKK